MTTAPTISTELFPADQIPAPDYNADPVTAWAADVLLGNIVAGPHVRNQCARHLRDLRDGPERGLVWDVEAANKVIGWFPRNLRLKDGQFQGRKFTLHPSQAFRVGSLFGWKWAATGLRRFRRFYDEEGKGNGKSPMLAGIGLYMLMADGEAAAEVYAAASKKDQAQVLFKDAVSMRNQSPRLSSRTTTQGENPVWQITYVGKKGDRRYFKPISSDDGQSGPRPHCGLCDEVHEHKNRNVIDLLEAGFKFRLQPLMLMATNSGTDRKSICWEEHQHAINVAAGITDDDTTMTFVCALDEGDDWENDPSCWPKVNPLLDVTITTEWLAGRVALAKAIPGKRNDIARLNFCEWTQSVNAAIKRESWLACQKKLDIAALVEAGYPCFGGLDLSQTRDFTAYTLTWVLDATKDAEVLASKTWFWTPEATLLDRAGTDQAPYDLWVRQGFIEAVPGERLKYAWLADAIARIHAEFAPAESAADQYGLERLREHLTDDIGASLPLTIHPQGFQKRILEVDKDKPDGEQEIYLWMPDSINKLENAIYEQRIQIEPNPMLDLCAASVVYAENRTGHRMFDKEHAFGRIDGMVSQAMSIGVALCRERSIVRSPWDDPEFSLTKARA
ncbi:terminase large subunit [Rhizobium sp. WW_1]|jgi:phage terminase large subunit-like protein|uniref:terminase large subunit n=1 Tax=Rhizobium sp. WW_1 TaxID=1907375 RepID=UPI0009DCF560|nr:terminase large subunit [Rhizobium sp. WW_1]RKD61545.1 phage terminase large subunit-like protein [Rhizobium sp. WW_1]